MIYHVPVLLEESKKFLLIKNEGLYFDGTIGFGGHTEKFLEALGNKSKIIGTDKDFDAFNFCQDKFKKDKRVVLYHSSFINIEKISKIEFIDGYDGIFADLGVSSYQLDKPDSGFTFREDAELDLRMNKQEGTSASHIVNTFSKEDLADIFYNYGEERNSRNLAAKIVEARKSKKIQRTGDLKDIIEKATNKKYLTKTLARVFQALRIYVNNELDELKEFLDKAVDLLNPGGRIVILSYHSLEDRIVKEKFRYENLECVCPPGTPVCVCGKVKRLKILTSKPVTASEEEINSNRRSRSVKLRAAEKSS